ncbi:DUF1641 domain-containing protein [Virgibacillus alimentarius]|uniref:Uncharacterized protein YjgD (DUF1641 family) n=1 Tax=Virgibacillus alimentarius TaxID=698769 RepID=A0ABS4S623_9BACI|nr:MULTISPECIES: DUF1641 domain-containing protein [Virgibacillus]MBP2256962.1 uncharacterized protein YjgD (DUF1641 family) [Virgibacillus alimentarius]HLR68048.1 DUF1641 domain-containing protein [Virgibacillus sp.]
MANPITKIKKMELSEQEVKDNNISEVIDRISENKEAILKSIEFLATLHESGVLEILNALTKQKDEAIANVVKQANKPEYATILENLSDLFLMTGELPVEELNDFSKKVTQGLQDVNTMETDKSTSYMDLFKALKDPEINRSVTMLLTFLRGMGKE